MTVKLLGAVLVIAGCGGCGFSLAAAHVREEQGLNRLIAALEMMKCDLQYRLTPLPDLCRLASRAAGGAVGAVFSNLAKELESQISPDVESCMTAALAKAGPLPRQTGLQLRRLGTSLGRFDLEGQLKGLEAARTECQQELDRLGKNREHRIRSYQTLGLCAGAAIAILFV